MKGELKTFAKIAGICVLGVTCWPLVMLMVIKDTCDEIQRADQTIRNWNTMHHLDATFPIEKEGL